MPSPDPGYRRARGASVLSATLRSTATAAGVSGSGLILMAEGVPRAVGGSDADAERLERVQVCLGSGPAFRGMVGGHPVAVCDLPGPYPHGHPELAPFAGPVRAVLSVPVRVGDVVAGSLDLYDRRPRRWPERQVRTCRELADIVAGVLRLLAADGRAGPRRDGSRVSDPLSRVDP